MKKVILGIALFALVAGIHQARVSAAQGGRLIGINVVLNTAITPDILSDLGRFGPVLDTIATLNAVHMRAREGAVADIAALPYVISANPDAERTGAPVDTVQATNFAGGRSTWDQDAIDVTNFAAGRVLPQDGSGVYVAVLDTGLLDSWRKYFPQERIAVQHARAFRGGGSEAAHVSSPTNMWEHDQNSHGTHVTSTILGYSLSGTPINGTAPMATVIPVKVLGQSGSGWSSVIAHGIVYVADLKLSGALGDAPVVINMSLGGSVLDGVEKAAVDYAIGAGVIIVAAAGNEGTAGMGYPGAYAPVISVAASGWTREWTSGSWWLSDVGDPTTAADFYIADFSSREKAGQDLDVAAPGSWVVGPYQLQSGKTSYYYLGGTSMSAPHVSGIVALMLQKNSALNQAAVEGILESTAIALPAGCRNVLQITGVSENICWGSDATGHGLTTAAAALAAVP